MCPALVLPSWQGGSDCLVRGGGGRGVVRLLGAAQVPRCLRKGWILWGVVGGPRLPGQCSLSLANPAYAASYEQRVDEPLPSSSMLSRLAYAQGLEAQVQAAAAQLVAETEGRAVACAATQQQQAQLAAAEAKVRELEAALVTEAEGRAAASAAIRQQEAQLAAASSRAEELQAGLEGSRQQALEQLAAADAKVRQREANKAAHKGFRAAAGCRGCPSVEGAGQAWRPGATPISLCGCLFAPFPVSCA